MYFYLYLYKTVTCDIVNTYNKRKVTKTTNSIKNPWNIRITNTKNLLQSSPKAIKVSYLLAPANWALEASGERERVNTGVHVRLFGIFFVRKRRLCRKYS